MSKFLVRKLVRVLFLLTSLYGVSLLAVHPEYIKLIDGRYAGRYEFLTNLGVILTIILILVSMLEDLSQLVRNGPSCRQDLRSGSKNGSSMTTAKFHFPSKCRLALRSFGPQLHSCKNTILALAFPIETLIAVLYWGLRAYDRSLLTSAHVLKAGLVMPFSTDISVHLLPALYVWIELLCFMKVDAKSYPVSEFRPSYLHPILLVSFNLAYMAWSHFLFLQNKRWAYPLLGRLTTLQHLFLLSFTSSFSLVVYTVGCKIYAYTSSSQKNVAAHEKKNV